MKGAGEGKSGRENKGRLEKLECRGDGKGQQESKLLTQSCCNIFFFLYAWNGGAFFQDVFLLMGK